VFQRLALGEMAALGATGLPLLVVQHPLGGEAPEGVSRRITQAVEQLGAIACHTGRESCFFRKLEDGRWVASDPVLKDPSLIYRK